MYGGRPWAHVVRAWNRRDQAGFGLIDSLAAIAIVGTAVLAAVACLLTILFSANAHQQSVRSGIEVTDLAEQIDRFPYQACATAITYGATISVVGYTAKVVQVEYLVEATTTTIAGTSTSTTIASSAFGSTCPPDRGVQRLTVEVTSTSDRPMTETVTIVKRNTTCPTSAGRPVGAPC